MRSAKEVEFFPYTMSTLCYIEVFKDGTVLRVHHKNKSDINQVKEAYERAIKNITVLYAVWPGKYSSDIFIIDDLAVFAESFKI